MVDFYHATLC